MRGFCNVWGVCMCEFCNVWVCVCVSFVICGCFGNMCTCIYCVVYCFTTFLYCCMYIYSYLFYLY